MVRSCIVCRCDYDKGHGFYEIPKNSEIRKKWCTACKISDYIANHPEKKVFVCFRHFGLESFTTNGKRMFLKQGKLYTYKRTYTVYHSLHTLMNNIPS